MVFYLALKKKVWIYIISWLNPDPDPFTDPDPVFADQKKNITVDRDSIRTGR
jgi:hypothetical protein